MGEAIESFQIEYFDDAVNRYKVPKSQWKRWSKFQRRVFNGVHSQMLHQQHLFTHPKTDEIPRDEWKTIAWNAAWTAAGMAALP